MHKKKEKPNPAICRCDSSAKWRRYLQSCRVQNKISLTKIRQYFSAFLYGYDRYAISIIDRLGTSDLPTDQVTSITKAIRFISSRTAEK